jgi:hypothetical protein
MVGFHTTVPEFHATIFDGGRVPSMSLLDHLSGLINARDAPRPLCQALNNHASSEAHLQHPVISCDLKKAGDPAAAIGIGAGRDDTSQPPRHTSGPTERAH